MNLKFKFFLEPKKGYQSSCADMVGECESSKGLTCQGSFGSKKCL